jgi:hypothetical protein
MRFKPCPWSVLGGLLIAFSMAVVIFAQAGNLQPLINSWAVASKAPQKPTVSLSELKSVVARLEELERKRAATPPTPAPVISPDYHKVTQVLARLEAMEQRRLAAMNAQQKQQPSTGAPQKAQQTGATKTAAKPRTTAATQQQRGAYVKATTTAPISFGSAPTAPLVTLGTTVQPTRGPSQ